MFTSKKVLNFHTYRCARVTCVPYAHFTHDFVRWVTKKTEMVETESLHLEEDKNVLEKGNYTTIALKFDALKIYSRYGSSELSLIRLQHICDVTRGLPVH